jgi:hypothetical protein
LGDEFLLRLRGIVMAQHSAALTSGDDAPPQSRPSRSRGLNLVDERGSPVFEEQSSFGLGFALTALIGGVIFTALLVTGKIGQPSLQASEPPLPLPSPALQAPEDERLLEEALERARVTNARLSGPVTVIAGNAATSMQSTSESPEAARQAEPEANSRPTSEAAKNDNPY